MKRTANEPRTVVGRHNDLLAVLLRKHGQLPQQGDAQLGVERSIDVVDCEEGWRFGTDEKREVEQQEKKAFIGASLIEEGIDWEIAIPNADAPLARTEILGDLEALKPID